MATDGVKIIDGDTAHDTYWGIMDLYDNGATIETIRDKFPFPQIEYFDDFDREIYITSYSLAIWEIGEMTDNVLQEVKNVIEAGACVKDWTEEIDDKAGNQRQKELDRLWAKINNTNLKVRKRKKYHVVKNFIYNINDVLTFKLSDDLYYATIVLNISQYRGNCDYYFGNIVYKDKSKPLIDTVKECDILGRKIPSGLNMDMTKILSLSMDEMMKQGGIDEILKRESERTGSYVIGMDMIGIGHKDLINMTNNFEVIGNLKLKEQCKEFGSQSGASNFNDLVSQFKNFEENTQIFGSSKFPMIDFLE
jgi:hypothetical protein